MPESDGYAAEQDMANRAGFGGEPGEVIAFAGPGEPQTGAEYAERITVAQLDAVRQALATDRAERDTIADRIRANVAQEEVLARAVAAFKRARRNDGGDA